MILLDLSVKGFADELASSSPAPGGGTVAALNGVLAASLGIMASELTMEKTKDLEPDKRELLTEIRDFCAKTKAVLADLAEEDTDAFNEVMAALHMPKDTDEQKDVRRTALRAANVHATRIPLETAKNSVALCEKLGILAANAKDSVLSDCGVSIECSRTAALGAFMNVGINLPGIKDENVKKELGDELEALEAKLKSLYTTGTANLSARFTY